LLLVSRSVSKSVCTGNLPRCYAWVTVGSDACLVTYNTRALAVSHERTAEATHINTCNFIRCELCACDGQCRSIETRYPVTNWSRGVDGRRAAAVRAELTIIDLHSYSLAVNVNLERPIVCRAIKARCLCYKCANASVVEVHYSVLFI
jgi:hypothetical protein